MIGLPPFEDGAVHVTVALPFPAVAFTPVGADGAVGAVGVTALDGDETGPAPGGVGCLHGEGVAGAAGQPGDRGAGRRRGARHRSVVGWAVEPM